MVAKRRLDRAQVDPDTCHGGARLDALLFAIGILILIASGMGATLLIGHRERSFRLIELLSLSFVLGNAFVSLALLCFGFFLHGIGLRSAVTAACLSVAGTGVAVMKWHKIKIEPLGRLRLIDLILLGVLVFQLGFVIKLTIGQTLFWDGLLNWEIKARYAFVNGGALPLDYFSDPTRGYSHPDYPLLMPLVETWVYLWIGRADQGIVKLILPFYYLAALGFLYIGGSRGGEGRWQRFLPALLLFFVPLALNRDGSASSGYPDFPMGVLYLASVLYLLEYLETKGRGALRLFACIGACICWTKSEGSILFLCLALVFGVNLLRRMEIKAFLIGILPGIFVVVAWRIFLKNVGAEIARDFYSFSLLRLWDNLGRSETIVIETLKELANWSHWGPLWLGVILTLPLFWAKRGQRQPLSLLFALILPMAAYPCVYYFTTWPVKLLMQGSLSRLLIHLTLVAVLILGLGMSTLSRPDPLQGDST
jgi:hypothetical protein